MKKQQIFQNDQSTKIFVRLDENYTGYEFPKQKVVDVSILEKLESFKNVLKDQYDLELTSFNYQIEGVTGAFPRLDAKSQSNSLSIQRDSMTKLLRETLDELISEIDQKSTLVEMPERAQN